MEFFGRIEHMEAVRSGISKATGMEWKSTVVVVKDLNSLKAVAVKVFGERNIEKLKQGEVGTIHYSTYVRDYQDKDDVTRYSNDISFDRWEPYAQQTQQQEAPAETKAAEQAPQQAAAPTAQPTEASKTGSDLPF